MRIQVSQANQSELLVRVQQAMLNIELAQSKENKEIEFEFRVWRDSKFWPPRKTAVDADWAWDHLDKIYPSVVGSTYYEILERLQYALLNIKGVVILEDRDLVALQGWD